MTLTVHLPAELEARLRQAAEAEGIPQDEFVLRTLEQRLMDDHRQAVLELLRRWSAEDMTTDPVEIEQREASWATFKNGLNEHHSSGRKVYP